MLGEVKRAQRALTVLELLIVVALVSIVLGLAAPSFQEMILVQRLKGINAQLVTDLQYGRSEAAARGKLVYFTMKTPAQSAGMSCYTLYTDRTDRRDICDCAAAPGARCAAPAVEIKTVQIPVDESVRLGLPAGQTRDFAFDPTTGGFFVPASDFDEDLPAGWIVDAGIDSTKVLRTIVSLAGRPTVCRPVGSTVSGGFAPCS